MKGLVKNAAIIAMLAGIAVSVFLMIHSLSVTVPEKYVRVSSSSAAYNYPWERDYGAQYLGGDAYNYMVEASLKAGYYSAAKTEKAVTGVGGLLLFFGSLSGFFFINMSIRKSKSIDRQTELLETIASKLTPANGDTPDIQPVTDSQEA